MATRLSEFISEIENDFSTYAESGDIDTGSILRWVTNELKRFGNNILTVHEKVVDIKNSQYTFENNFKNLKLALKVEPFGRVLEGCSDEEYRGSYYSRKRIEHGAYFNDVSLEYVKSCNAKIIEEIVTLKTGTARVCYNAQWLKVVKGMKRDSISADCLNISKNIRDKNCYEISITGNTLQTNFNSGLVYLQYYGLDEDEDGEILIPEILSLEQYLENFVKYKLILGWIGNGRNPGATAQLLSFYKAEADNYFSLAMTASKFKTIADGSWKGKARLQNRINFNRFKLPKI